MISPVAGWLVGLVLLGAGGPKKAEPVTLSGTVMELADALQPTGLTFDAGPIAKQVVVRDDNGVIIPLLSDDASRALFQDERLRDRRAVIQGLRFLNMPYIQVVSFQVKDHGRLRTPEYYCEVCTISVRFPQTCPCCQGPMELRMKPEGR